MTTKLLFAALASLLPGDAIHDVAPSTLAAKRNLHKREQIDAAEAKRKRKQAARLARGRL